MQQLNKENKELLDFIEKTGSFRKNYDLSKVTWFGVGGDADLLFRPKNAQELQEFLQIKGDLPIFVMGVGSNIIVADSGFRGCVIRFTREFSKIENIGDCKVKVGVAALDLMVAKQAASFSIAGLEFLSGIPGSIGGAIKMNAGAYGGEVKDVLISATGYNLQGEYREYSLAEMNYEYRKSKPKEELIFTSCILQGGSGAKAEILAKIEKIKESRESSQPVREKTGGSTFKNPENYSAWKLIDEAGARGLTVGKAQMSEMHCNFMINLGGATSEDLLALGEKVREMVKNSSGVQLEWEIKRVGMRFLGIYECPYIS